MIKEQTTSASMLPERPLPVCPFYLGEGLDSIVCEGMAARSRSVQMFGNRASKEAWFRSVCASARCGRLCPITCIQNYLYDEMAPRVEPKLRRYTPPEIRSRRCLARRRQKPCGK